MRTLHEYNTNRSAEHVRHPVVKSPNPPMPTKPSCNRQKFHPGRKKKKGSNIMKCILELLSVIKKIKL